MKKSLIVLFIMIILSLSLNAKDTQIPKSLKIIGLTGTSSDYIINAIDLQNNEIILIVYRAAGEIFKFVKVERTGIIVDPKDYSKITLNNTPFTQ